MRPSRHLFLLILAAVALLALIPFYPVNSLAAWQDSLGFKRQVDTFSDVLSLIRNSYVDDVTPQRLVDGAMSGMLKTLDPYSQFLDQRAYSELRAQTRGEFGGIGLEVSVKGGVLHVISPLDGSSADRAGIKPGDLVVKIDGTLTKDMTLGDAVRRMRGQPGSTVTLSILHEGEKDVLDIAVPREVVKVRGVREAKLLEGGAGYIRISEFQEQTAKDFKQALEDLQRQGMKGLIIDVRNNPGGLLGAAVKVAENFVPEGKLVVSTRGRLLSKNQRYLSQNKEPFKIQPLVLLVNKGSASGSEILAGALQDHALGTLVGTKTYGKGCIQTLTPLPGGSAVRITTSRYYTPNGKLIHEIGITPDIQVQEDAKSGKDLPLERAMELVR